MRATADPSTARDDIVLVDIDEQSIRALAPYFGRWPWPRLVHAHLLDFLARSRPKVVLYDILFGEPDRSKFTIGDDQWTGGQSDSELVGSAKKLGSVVFVGDATEEASSAEQHAVSQSPAQLWIEPRPRYNPPMPALRDVSRGAGHNLLALDADGVARRCIPFVRVGDATIPALAVEGAIEALGLHMSDVRFDADGFWLADRLYRWPRRRHRRSTAARASCGGCPSPTGAYGRTSGGPIGRTRSRSCFNPRNSCWQARKPTSIRQPSMARSSSSARRPPGSTTRRPCPSRRRCRAPRSTPTSWTAFSRVATSRLPRGPRRCC